MSRQVDLGQIVPNIQVGTTRTTASGGSANVVNIGTSLNPILDFYIPKGDPGAIKFEIVQTLPQTGSEDTIYLVPLAEPDVEGNNYAEYLYVNGTWELLGKIGVQVDLSNYYTKDEIDDMVGDVENILTTLDVGGGV